MGLSRRNLPVQRWQLEIKKFVEDRGLLHRLRRNILLSGPDRSVERFLAELREVALGCGHRKA